MKISVSEDGEAGDDWIVESGAQGLRSVDLPSSLVLELPEKTKLMRLMDSGDIWYVLSQFNDHIFGDQDVGLYQDNN